MMLSLEIAMFCGFYFSNLKKEEMLMSKKPITTELQTIKSDFLKFYEICESHGVSKEIISNFLTLQGGIQHAKNTKRT